MPAILKGNYDELFPLPRPTPSRRVLLPSLRDCAAARCGGAGRRAILVLPQMRLFESGRLQQLLPMRATLSLAGASSAASPTTATDAAELSARQFNRRYP